MTAQNIVSRNYPLEAGVIVQSIKSLPHKHEDLTELGPPEPTLKS